MQQILIISESARFQSTNATEESKVIRFLIVGGVTSKRFLNARALVGGYTSSAEILRVIEVVNF